MGTLDQDHNSDAQTQAAEPASPEATSRSQRRRRRYDLCRLDRVPMQRINDAERFLVLLATKPPVDRRVEQG